MNKTIKIIGVLLFTSSTILGAMSVIHIPTPKTDKCIIVYGDIDDQMFRSVVDQYKTLVNKDSICVDIETNGGLLSAAVDIMVFLENNTIERTMIVDKYAHSAGALLMLSGTHLQMSPRALSVIHVPRIGIYEGALVIDAEYNVAFNRVFLSSGRGSQVLREHVNDYLSGSDVWLTGSDVVSNLKDYKYAQLKGEKYTYLQYLINKYL
jgi:ATP-dependent protease ClpP protease subunit